MGVGESITYRRSDDLAALGRLAQAATALRAELDAARPAVDRFVAASYPGIGAVDCFWLDSGPNLLDLLIRDLDGLLTSNPTIPPDN